MFACEFGIDAIYTDGKAFGCTCDGAFAVYYMEIVLDDSISICVHMCYKTIKMINRHL